jgi:hypothetical protein
MGSDRNGCGVGERDAGAAHLGQRAVERAVEVDGPAGVDQHRRPEAEPRRVERRIGDAEVGGEPGEPDRLDPALAQVAGEAGRRRAVVLEEGRVAVDVRA